MEPVFMSQRETETKYDRDNVRKGQKGQHRGGGPREEAAQSVGARSAEGGRSMGRRLQQKSGGVVECGPAAVQLDSHRRRSGWAADSQSCKSSHGRKRSKH
eukprot:6176091-Pleurochrysis_carterae.AAC.3